MEFTKVNMDHQNKKRAMTELKSVILTTINNHYKENSDITTEMILLALNEVSRVFIYPSVFSNINNINKEK